MRILILLVLAWVFLTNINYCQYKLLGKDAYMKLHFNQTKEIKENLTISCSCYHTRKKIKYSLGENIVLLAPGARHVTPTHEENNYCNVYITNRSNNTYKDVYIVGTVGDYIGKMSMTETILPKRSEKIKIPVFGDEFSKAIKSKKKIKCEIVSVN
jgi:hypothetical protein